MIRRLLVNLGMVAVCLCMAPGLIAWAVFLSHSPVVQRMAGH